MDLPPVSMPVQYLVGPSLDSAVSLASSLSFDPPNLRTKGAVEPVGKIIYLGSPVIISGSLIFVLLGLAFLGCALPMPLLGDFFLHVEDLHLLLALNPLRIWYLNLAKKLHHCIRMAQSIANPLYWGGYGSQQLYQVYGVSGLAD
ncbi:hypothetical protein DSO57_1030643 [Entomophthora muscae]|uniref:Uncharacterized protein n=1 Tax=Entomophthora muscae TaxID=34485 RepID=A0ACC2SDY5_9FUNG|nr:hypothetical protein DSO57_1030643 [Entomophthora muscae]